MQYPRTRLRRLRQHDWLRRLTEETSLSVNDLVLPLFVTEGKKIQQAVPSMPGIYRYSIDLLVNKVKTAADAAIPAIALFPVIDRKLKNEKAEESYNPDNLICRTIKAIKKEVPDIGIICDVALDPYTSHGHDGLVRNGYVANDETIKVLCKQALVQAQAGCDIIAPSDMMDGRIGAIRDYLDKSGFENVCIISYAVKYASAFYGPFRDAVGSAQNLKGADKKTYQMNPANSGEALREVAMDIDEGADIVMIKPALPYLDIIQKVSTNFNIPVFAYQVSGEYAMLKAAASNGWLEEEKAILESLFSIKRAGAKSIFTYAALEIAALLKK